MSSNYLLAYRLFTAAALALVASSCSSQGAVVPRYAGNGDAQARRSAEPALSAQAIALVLAPAVGSNLYLFNRQHVQVATIAVQENGVSGMGAVAVDPRAQIYLAHSGYPSATGVNVLIFRPPYTGRPMVVSAKKFGTVSAVAVDWKHAVFAVTTNGFSVSSPAHVLFFRIGASEPCASVSLPVGAPVSSSASFDRQGVLFSDQAISNAYQVFSVAGGCAASTFRVYSPQFSSINNIRVNGSNQLVIDTTGNSNTGILTFAHPSGGSLGSPVAKTILDEINGAPAALVTLSADGTKLWAAPFFQPGVGLYRYPQGGSRVAIIKNLVDPFGAVYPQLQP